MSVGNDAFSDPRFATLDAPGVVELCNSLADYGEAGGLSRELMLQVGSFAEARFTDDLEVLLAVARMYLLGGETVRARATLVRAGKRWPDESRVRPLLAHALRLLDDHRTVDDVLRDSRVSMRPSAPPRASSMPPAPARRSVVPERRVPVRAATPPGLPMVKVRDPAATSPTSEIARARAVEAPRAAEWAHEDSLAPTPASGMPIVPRAPAVPRGMGLRTPPHTPTVPRMRAQTGPAAAARVQRIQEEAMLRAASEVRTEIARRAVQRDSELPPEPTPTPRSQREMGGVPRTTRIRLLEPDDERRRLDPYELIGELASGGMATVFLGRLAGAGGFQRFVAIKRLHPHLEREEQFVKMFLDEGRIAAAIHHPHVVPILEVGMSDAGYYLVMEFIEGDTLAGLIVRSLQRGKPMPPNVAARIVLDSLAGLHAAHQLTDGDQYLGLVHRDCTPQNILVGIDGSARVTDFGVARAAARLAYTQPQQVKGKVAYLSPEQAHATELDRRSDVFTMGIVLWEALAGRPLFQGETEAATLSRLLAGKVPPVQSFAPEVPASLDEVCRRALAQDRNRRYRTAAEMAEALERAVSSEGFGGAASPRDLGRYVEQVMGAEIAAQRDMVRNWLAQHESTPMSRGPRSAAVRSPASPRTAPPPAMSPSSLRGEQVSDDAPDTPPPPGEKHPRLSSPEPLPGEPPEEQAATESPPPAAAGEESPTIEAHEEDAEAETDEAAEEPEAEEPEAPREGLSGRASAMMPAWMVRLTSMKLSTRQGTLMVIAIVLLAVAPLLYKVAKQRFSPRPTTTAQSAKRAKPAPHPKATAGWDEGEWPLPDAGARSPGE